MRLVLVLLALLGLAVALFALQNPDPVTVRFLAWQVHPSVALLTIGALMVGALMAALLAVAGRLRRWRRGAPDGPGPGPAAPPPRPGRPVTPGP